MFPANRTTLLIFLCSLTLNQFSYSQETKIEFDVPALISAKEISQQSPASLKTIEIQLPISTIIDASIRNEVKEFRFDVSWNKSLFPIVDYGPRTQTVSDIEGFLSIEENASETAGFNFNVNSKPFDWTTANLSSDFGNANSKRQTFQEIPQHDVLVASGTIDRGTGGFFRFHPSKTQTIEGSRDLSLSWQVPATWRNGILKVSCRATGSHRVAGLWNEPFEVGRCFVVPLYIENDSASQKLAIDFVRAEQGLRKSWNTFNKELKSETPAFPFGLMRAKGKSKLPQTWPHLLIQSGDDRYLSQYEGYLTQDVAVSAGKFVQARNSLESN